MTERLCNRRSLGRGWSLRDGACLALRRALSAALPLLSPLRSPTPSLACSAHRHHHAYRPIHYYIVQPQPTRPPAGRLACSSTALFLPIASSSADPALFLWEKGKDLRPYNLTSNLQPDILPTILTLTSTSQALFLHIASSIPDLTLFLLGKGKRPKTLQPDIQPTT